MRQTGCTAKVGNRYRFLVLESAPDLSPCSLPQHIQIPFCPIKVVILEALLVLFSGKAVPYPLLLLCQYSTDFHPLRWYMVRNGKRNTSDSDQGLYVGKPHPWSAPVRGCSRPRARLRSHFVHTHNHTHCSSANNTSANTNDHPYVYVTRVIV